MTGNLGARGRQRGFTLIEVVVALAIAALALGALFHAIQSGVNGAATAAGYTEAVRHAQSRLAMIDALGELVPGVRSGEDDDGFFWRVEVTPVEAHPTVPPPDGAPPSPAPVLFSVDVTAGWRAAGGVREITLRTLRVARLGHDES